jgi:hypothetical protein
VGDLPDVAARVGEAGGSDAPCPVLRTIEERHATPDQFFAHRVDVIDRNRELRTRPRRAISHGGWPDEPGGLTLVQEMINVSPNRNTAECSSSNSTGKSNTSW